MEHHYEFTSCFAPYIETLIALKRKEGFIYDTGAYQLKCFDTFCLEKGITEAVMTKDLMTKWGTLRETEDKPYLTRRISAIRQLSLFMNSTGKEAYVPIHFNHKSSYVAYVMIDDEITAFFEHLDNYRSKLKSDIFNRLAVEYKVIFRVIYCCGLRISEARKLKTSDVDLGKGILTIRQSKGQKDRLVYMSADLTSLCREYFQLLGDGYHIKSDWFFPGRKPASILTVATLDLKFNTIWKRTSYSSSCEHKPTVHSLRYPNLYKIQTFLGKYLILLDCE